MQLAGLAQQEIVRASLASQGGIAVIDSVDEAIDLANAFAPEHLCLLVADAWSLVGKVRHAGGVFVGEYSSEALGDYVVGPSHIMPTGQTARFSSPVNIWDFVKITSVFGVSREDAEQMSPAAMALATAEGLRAHAAAIGVRLAQPTSGEKAE